MLTDPHGVARHPERLEYGQAEFWVRVERQAQVAGLALCSRPSLGLDELDRLAELKRIGGDQIEPDMQHGSPFVPARPACWSRRGARLLAA